MPQAEIDLIFKVAQDTPRGTPSSWGSHQVCYDWVYDFQKTLMAELTKMKGLESLKGVSNQKILILSVPFGSAGNNWKDYPFYKRILPGIYDTIAGGYASKYMIPNTSCLNQEHTVYQITLNDKSAWYIDIGIVQTVLKYGSVNDFHAGEEQVSSKLPSGWTKTDKVGVRSGLPNLK